MSQTIQRAATVLELVSIRPRTQSEVAEVLGVHRSTALRILGTLGESGLVRRRPDGTYGVGYRLTWFASLASEQFELRDLARPRIAELGAECGHTVHLAVLEDDRIVYADKIDQPGTVRMYSQIGQPVRLHTSGVAKAILAHVDAEVLERMLDGYAFERFTSTTLTSRGDFDDDLAAVRQRGWASDDGEFEDFINCVAMPVRGPDSKVIAAVSITALRAQAELDELEGLLPRLAQVCEGISKSIGWRP
ncbi:transcriptional regulator, IclR family [Agrococcus baldri]|uniref:Transcriptional regulator, IclR family n=1 Tax=Agrococcus baldri TaxID=153730 RepID=A0AA94HLZ7_9MICO|nr:IclR family transcriptional regulator [Agrococcus baldri]SFS09078.1 transcriptional regulator, IclR family [Agrococcus baldri]